MRNVMLVIRWQIIERDQGVGDIPFADFRHEAVRANTFSPASSLGDRGPSTATKSSIIQSQAQYL